MEKTLATIDWNPIVTVRPNTRVSEVARLLDAKGVDGVVIVHSRTIPVACFGREHLASPPLPPDVPYDQIKVGPVATTCPFAFAPDTPISEAMRRMRLRDLSFAPVARDGKLAGVVTLQQLQEV